MVKHGVKGQRLWLIVASRPEVGGWLNMASKVRSWGVGEHGVKGHAVYQYGGSVCRFLERPAAVSYCGCRLQLDMRGFEVERTRLSSVSVGRGDHVKPMRGEGRRWMPKSHRPLARIPGDVRPAPR